MVSFQCEGCNDVVTKKKLDQHIGRCYADVTCIDCMTTFHDWSYRQHTTCISEAQKTQGALYKEKKKGALNSALQTAPRTPTASTETAVAKVNVPPPAPSPPRVPDAVNALDYLVQDASPITSASKPSPRKAKRASSPKSLQATLDGKQSSSGVTYGSGPVPRSLDRFESGLNSGAEAQFDPLLDDQNRTPHLTRIVEPPNHKNDKSEKKRKRAVADDLDLASAKNNKGASTRSLHTGLTGGLSKLLANAEDRNDEASPSSPKKRSKHLKISKRDDSSDDEKHKRRKDKPKSTQGDSNGDMRLVRTEPASRAVEVHDRGRQLARTGPRQKMEQGNSEFFLSLIDKGPKSSKGQSIWGVLKMFHEGQRDEQLAGHDELIAFHQNAERALFRGLRMKLNKDGEIVLFARADKEHSVGAD